MLAHYGRIRLEGSLRDWVEAAQGHLPVQEAPLNAEVAVTSLEINLPHRDPADRFIAATALVYSLTLATVDKRLIAERWLTTRSS